MKARNTRKAFTLSISLAAILAFSACSPSDLMFWESKVVDDEAARKNPLFWDVATQIEGTTNLYSLSPELFENKPYSEIMRFGDNILLVGQAVYADSETSSNEGYGEEAYEFSFDLYSPWRNAFVNSIEHDENSCISYAVLADHRLVLFNGFNKFELYDQSLNLIGKYKYSSGEVDLSSAMYSTPESDTLILSDFDSGLIELTLPDASDDTEEWYEISANRISIDLIGTDVIEATSDSKNLVINGINPTTLRRENCYFNLTTKEITKINEFQSSYSNNYSSVNYITLWDGNNSIHRFHKSDGTDAYWCDDSITKYIVLDDDSFAVRQANYSEENMTYTLSALLFDKNGKSTSGFSYVFNSEKNGVFEYPATNSAFFEEDQLVFYLVSGSDTSPYLLIWKTSDPGQYSSELAFTDNFTQLQNQFRLDQLNAGEEIVPYTMISNYSSYDWNDLKDCRILADSLEEKYHIEIYLGEEVPTDMESYTVNTVTDSDTVKEALNKFDQICSQYPDGFFEQLKYGEISTLRFYFSGSLMGKGGNTVTEAAAFVSHDVDSTRMVLNCEDTYGWLNTIHHELSHIIDQRLSYQSNYCSDRMTDFEEDWAALNPSDFTYSEDYANYFNYDLYDKYSDYFISSYSSTYPTEDRAEIFSKAWEYADGDTYLKDVFFNDKIMKKMKYYSERIREGFDTTGWPEELPWEKIIK